MNSKPIGSFATLLFVLKCLENRNGMPLKMLQRHPYFTPLSASDLETVFPEAWKTFVGVVWIAAPLQSSIRNVEGWYLRYRGLKGIWTNCMACDTLHRRLSMCSLWLNFEVSHQTSHPSSISGTSLWSCIRRKARTLRRTRDFFAQHVYISSNMHDYSCSCYLKKKQAWHNTDEKMTWRSME